MAEETTETTEAPAPPEKKKSPVMLIVIIILAAFVIGGGGAVAFLLFTGSDETQAPQDQKADQPKATSAVKKEKLGPIVMLEPFIVNLAGSGGRNYLKVSINLELANEQLQNEITNKMPKIRDAILLILSTKTFEEIKSSEGKLVLKNELLKRLNSYLMTGMIDNIYFTSFVIQ